MKCIIPCAGENSRMGKLPKALLEINGKPILQHIIDSWSHAVEYFIFVVRRNAYWTKGILDIIPENSAIVFQDEPKGLADAILKAEAFVDGRFIVTLGDCLYKGSFDLPTNLFTHNTDMGVGVWNTMDTKEVEKSYLVDINHKQEFITKLEEKPKLPEEDIEIYPCGMGVYFMDKRLFFYIKTLLPKIEPGGGDLTNILEAMVEDGRVIRPVYFKGNYINVTSINDIEKAEEFMK